MTGLNTGNPWAVVPSALPCLLPAYGRLSRSTWSSPGRQAVCASLRSWHLYIRSCARRQCDRPCMLPTMYFQGQSMLLAFPHRHPHTVHEWLQPYRPQPCFRLRFWFGEHGEDHLPELCRPLSCLFPFPSIVPGASSHVSGKRAGSAGPHPSFPLAFPFPSRCRAHRTNSGTPSWCTDLAMVSVRKSCRLQRQRIVWGPGYWSRRAKSHTTRKKEECGDGPLLSARKKT